MGSVPAPDSQGRGPSVAEPPEEGDRQGTAGALPARRRAGRERHSGACRPHPQHTRCRPRIRPLVQQAHVPRGASASGSRARVRSPRSGAESQRPERSPRVSPTAERGRRLAVAWAPCFQPPHAAGQQAPWGRGHAVRRTTHAAGSKPLEAVSGPPAGHSELPGRRPGSALSLSRGGRPPGPSFPASPPAGLQGPPPRQGCVSDAPCTPHRLWK